MLSAAEEIKKLEKIKKRMQPLRDRMDADNSRLMGVKYQIPKEEGKWESVTSNKIQSEGNKIINLLTHAKRKLYIPSYRKGLKVRSDNTATEDLVNGMIYSASRMYDSDPFIPSLHGSATHYRVNRGWGCYRLYLHEDKDGNIICDIAVWDVRNTHFLTGKNGFIWVANSNICFEEDIKDEFEGWNGKSGSLSAGDGIPEGMVEKVNIFAMGDKVAEEAVIAGGEYVREPEGIGLDYIPVRIKPGGSTPLIQDNNSDNIQYVGESFQVNNRHLHEVESRLLSYNATAAGEEAGAPTILLWDSTKSDMPKDWNAEEMKDPRGKKNIITIDVGKGQAVGDPLPVSQGNRVNLMLQTVSGMEDIGGISKVGFGMINQALPAQGIDILMHSTMEALLSFIESLQGDYVWMAHEIVSQYKNGKFQDTEVEGFDKNGYRYKAEVKSQDVQVQEFQCEIVPDLLRDRQMHVNMAASEVKSGLVSKRTARDVHQLTEDPDHEEEIIAEERALEIAELGALDAAFAMYKDAGRGDSLEARQKRFKALRIMQKIAEASQPPEQPGTGPQPQPQGEPQGNIIATERPTVPQPIVEAARGANNAS